MAQPERTSAVGERPDPRAAAPPRRPGPAVGRRLCWRGLLGAALCAPALALVPATVAQADGSCTTSNGQVTCIFGYTGGAQTWTVPNGVTQATFDVYGAQGGNVPSFTSGGAGGGATATLGGLVAGEALTITVGGQGGSEYGCYNPAATGGFNGGGGGGGGRCPGAGGGGASDVRIGGGELSDRVLIAGGGGGAADAAGGNYVANGGAGGGTTGGTGCTGGYCSGGSGGNQDGSSGSGQLGVGGVGTNGDNFTGGLAGGGGGGGGYYGGAGGGQDTAGGGGSGYGPAGVVFHSGVRYGDGEVIITYQLPDTTPPTASPTQSPAANAAGWNNTDVTVNWNWADNPGGSGIDPSNCTTSSTSSGEGTITLSASCQDLAGNKATASYTVKVDKTPPTSVSGTPTTAPNANGWYNAPVTVAFTGQDATSGIAGCTSAVYKGPDSAAATVSGTCTDVAGNTSAPAASAAFRYDATPPTIGASAVTADGKPYQAGSWTNQAVTVHYTCADATSGVASCPADQTVSAEGANQAASGAATDQAGNSASAGFGPIDIDKTPPTIVAAATTQPNANGWYDANVVVHFTCQDALSGIPAGACPADQTLSAEGNAVSSTAQTVADAAGNTSAPSNVVTVKIDKTPPVVSVTGVSNGASYTLGAVPAAGCATSDALSGVATPATLSVTGGNSDGVGAFTATCAGATDQAGNAAPPVSAAYTVGYAFGGFLAPVRNPPTVNSGKAGRTYPVKFQLTNANGASISSLAAVQSVTYQATGCAAFASAPTDALTTTATGGTSLRYDATANQYVYTWATPTAAGCYTLFLTLDSGQVFPADFNLQ